MNVCLLCCSLYLVRVLIVVIMVRWSEFSACIVCQVVRLYSVVEIVVISGEVACCSVVCGTLVGGSVFSVMCFKLLLLLLYALFNHPRLLIQVARVQKAQFSYRLDGLVP